MEFNERCIATALLLCSFCNISSVFRAAGDMYEQASAAEDGDQSANNRTVATRISGASFEISPSHADEFLWRLCSARHQNLYHLNYSFQNHKLWFYVFLKRSLWSFCCCNIKHRLLT